MTLELALKVVEKRYGLGEPYLDERTGKMHYVVRAERELRAIPEVKMPQSGIALLAYEVVDLAEGTVTIEKLVRKKNPELFMQEIVDEISSTQEEIDPTERELILKELSAMSFDELQNSQTQLQSELAQTIRLAAIEKLKLQVALTAYEDSLRDR